MLAYARCFVCTVGLAWGLGGCGGPPPRLLLTVVDGAMLGERAQALALELTRGEQVEQREYRTPGDAPLRFPATLVAEVGGDAGVEVAARVAALGADAAVLAAGEGRFTPLGDRAVLGTVTLK